MSRNLENAYAKCETRLTRAIGIIASLATVFLLAACGSGGGGGGNPLPALQPPANFTASQGPDFNTVAFTWTPAGGGITGYEAEGRMEDGAWTPLGTTLPSNAIGGSITFVDTLPELTHFSFHIRSVRNSDRSSWSPEVAYLRTLRPPRGLWISLAADQERVFMSWFRDSTANTGTRIERALMGSGPMGPYELVTDLPPDATSYTDAGAAELGTYTYRVRHTAGSDLGLEATGISPVTALRLPIGLSAQSVQGGITLQWTNRSTKATAIAVYRKSQAADPTSPLTVIAELPPTATSYPDSSLAVGAYTYALEVRGGSTPRQTDPVSAYSLPNGWSGNLLSLPWCVSTPGPNGQWFGVDDSMQTSTITLYRSVGASWETHALPEGAWAVGLPKILVDGNGHPHAIYVWHDPILSAGPNDIRHTWHDGTNWQEEVIVTGQKTSPLFGLAPDGTIQLVWTNYDPSNGSSLEHAVRVGQTWTITPITSAYWTYNQDSMSLKRFGVAPDGSAFLALGLGINLHQLVLQRRLSDGTWSEELAPVPGIECSSNDALALLPFSATQVDLVYNLLVWEGTPQTLQAHANHIRKTAAGWGSPEAIDAQVGSPSVQVQGASLSPDGQRLVLAQGTGFRTWDSIGGWPFTDLHGIPATAWFDATNQLHVLIELAASTTPPYYLHTYEELIGNP